MNQIFSSKSRLQKKNMVIKTKGKPFVMFPKFNLEHKRFASRMSVFFMCGLLAACQSTPSEPPVRPNYQTQSERAVEGVAICVAEKGKDVCRSQAAAACKTIQREAFNNPYSAGSTLKNFSKGDAATKKRFKLATSNTVMRKLGFGKNFCG